MSLIHFVCRTIYLHPRGTNQFTSSENVVFSFRWRQIQIFLFLVSKEEYHRIYIILDSKLKQT